MCEFPRGERQGRQYVPSLPCICVLQRSPHLRAGAKWHYNLRVVETLVGARVLANKLGIQLGPTDRPTFRVILSRWLGTPESELDTDALKVGIERFLPEVEKLRPGHEGRPAGEEGVTMQEMIELSGLGAEQFHKVYLSWVEGAPRAFSSPVYPLNDYVYDYDCMLINPLHLQSRRSTSSCTSARGTSSQRRCA